MPPKGYQPLKGVKINVLPEVIFHDSNEVLNQNSLWNASLVFSHNKSNDTFTFVKDRFGGNIKKVIDRDELIEFFYEQDRLSMSQLKDVLGTRALNKLKKQKPHYFV